MRLQLLLIHAGTHSTAAGRTSLGREMESCAVPLEWETMHFLGLHPQLPLLSLWHRLGMREDIALSKNTLVLREAFPKVASCWVISQAASQMSAAGLAGCRQCYRGECALPGSDRILSVILPS